MLPAGEISFSSGFGPALGVDRPFSPGDAACCGGWALWYGGSGGGRFIVVKLVSTLVATLHGPLPPEAKKKKAFYIKRYIDVV